MTEHRPQHRRRGTLAAHVGEKFFVREGRLAKRENCVANAVGNELVFRHKGATERGGPFEMRLADLRE